VSPDCQRDQRSRPAHSLRSLRSSSTVRARSDEPPFALLTASPFATVVLALLEPRAAHEDLARRRLAMKREPARATATARETYCTEHCRRDDAPSSSFADHFVSLATYYVFTETRAEKSRPGKRPAGSDPERRHESTSVGRRHRHRVDLCGVARHLEGVEEVRDTVDAVPVLMREDAA